MYEIQPTALAGRDYAFATDWDAPLLLGDDEVLVFSVYRRAPDGTAQWVHDAGAPADAFAWLGQHALSIARTLYRLPAFYYARKGVTLASSCALNVIALEA